MFSYGIYPFVFAQSGDGNHFQCFRVKKDQNRIDFVHHYMHALITNMKLYMYDRL